MTRDQTIWTAAGAIIVPAFEFLYGMGEAVLTSMIALLFFIGLDWISGISAARRDNSYGSSYGIDGIGRTLFMLLLPAGGHMLDLVFKMPGLIFGALTAGLLYHVIQSMLSNSIRAGWATWLPIGVIETLVKWVGSELDKKVQRSVQRGGAVTPIIPVPDPEAESESLKKDGERDAT